MTIAVAYDAPLEILKDLFFGAIGGILVVVLLRKFVANKISYVIEKIYDGSQQNNISVREEQFSPTESGNIKVHVAYVPVQINGNNVGWYKNDGDEEWRIGTFENNDMAVEGAIANKPVLVKYLTKYE